jgi:hypothetical protein
VHAANEHGPQYPVTEFVDGTLHDPIESQRPHGWRRCVELLIGVAVAGSVRRAIEGFDTP